MSDDALSEAASAEAQYWKDRECDYCGEPVGIGCGFKVITTEAETIQDARAWNPSSLFCSIECFLAMIGSFIELKDDFLGVEVGFDVAPRVIKALAKYLDDTKK